MQQAHKHILQQPVSVCLLCVQGDACLQSHINSVCECPICAVCVSLCVLECVCVCGMGSYKDPSVGETDHKPREQLILSL